MADQQRKAAYLQFFTFYKIAKTGTLRSKHLLPFWVGNSRVLVEFLPKTKRSSVNAPQNIERESIFGRGGIFDCKDWELEKAQLAI